MVVWDMRCYHNSGTKRKLNSLSLRQAFFVLRVLFEDSSRAKARRAISEGACSGNGNTELTLISQSTWLSSPDAVRGPYKKSASQMIGSDSASISSNCIIWGVHSDSIFVLRGWNGAADAGC